MAKPKIVIGGVDEYITSCPKEVQARLAKIRAAIQAAAPGSHETVSYFKMPGYFYEGDYDYSGMFAWFSYKKPNTRLHVRPPVSKDYANELKDYETSVGAVFFPEDKDIPGPLVKKLVKASVKVMKHGR